MLWYAITKTLLYDAERAGGLMGLIDGDGFLLVQKPKSKSGMRPLEGGTKTDALSSHPPFHISLVAFVLCKTTASLDWLCY